MVSTLLAHDLLWGMTPQQLPADAPSWVVESISAGQPVVVRRAQGATDHHWLAGTDRLDHPRRHIRRQLLRGHAPQQVVSQKLSLIHI